MALTFTTYIDDNVDISDFTLGYDFTPTGHAWLRLDGGPSEQNIETGFQRTNTLKSDTDRSDTGLNVVARTFEITQEQYDKVVSFINNYEAVLGNPMAGAYADYKYNLADNNCVDFVQRTWDAMFPGEEFVNYFFDEELPGAAGKYAEIRYETVEEIDGQITKAGRVLFSDVSVGDVYADEQNTDFINRAFTTEEGDNRILIKNDDVVYVDEAYRDGSGGRFHIVVNRKEDLNPFNNRDLVGTDANDLGSAVDYDRAHTLAGGEGDDILYGGRGSDKLIGDAGDDWLNGLWGNDKLTGGGGSDGFAYGLNGAGRDKIADFSTLDEDYIELFDFGTPDTNSDGFVNSFDENVSVRFGDLIMDFFEEGGGRLEVEGVSELTYGSDIIVVEQEGVPDEVDDAEDSGGEAQGTNDGKPVVSATDQALDVGEYRNVSSWLSASDSNGDAINWWAVWDYDPAASSGEFRGDGYAVDGSAIEDNEFPAAQAIRLSSDQLASLEYGGADKVGTEYLAATAWDGDEWGKWTTFEIVIA